MPGIQQPDLWSLVQDQHWIDPDELFAALEHEAGEGELDYRTRLLIRDALQTLQRKWGGRRFEARLANSLHRPRLEAILHEVFERVGFPSLKHRVVEPMDPHYFEMVFRLVGEKIRHEVTAPVGGSVSLILQGMLRRRTEDIDIVDEVPADLRREHAFLHVLERDYRIRIAHFQQHYLPLRWQTRTHWHGTYGPLTVTLVDAVDIFAGKLCSVREKDRHDLSVLLPQLDRAAILRRLRDDCAPLLASETNLERATRNWHILTGDNLLPLG